MIDKKERTWAKTLSKQEFALLMDIFEIYEQQAQLLENWINSLLRQKRDEVSFLLKEFQPKGFYGEQLRRNSPNIVADKVSPLIKKIASDISTEKKTKSKSLVKLESLINRRFNQIGSKKHYGKGRPEKISTILSKMVEVGILKRKEIKNVQTSHSYQRTKKGFWLVDTPTNLRTLIKVFKEQDSLDFLFNSKFFQLSKAFNISLEKYTSYFLNLTIDQDLQNNIEANKTISYADNIVMQDYNLYKIANYRKSLFQYIENPSEFVEKQDARVKFLADELEITAKNMNVNCRVTKLQKEAMAKIMWLNEQLENTSKDIYSSNFDRVHKLLLAITTHKREGKQDRGLNATTPSLIVGAVYPKMEPKCEQYQHLSLKANESMEMYDYE